MKELRNLKSITFHKNKNGAYYLTEVSPESIVAENTYVKIREMESRIYGDAVAAGLPEILSSHPHYKEWLIRKRSAQKLISYISQKRNFKNILDLGCGNGWLSSLLAAVDNTFVTGIDINVIELEQAARVFKRNNLIFAYADVFDPSISSLGFDIIVLSGVIQYFPDIKKLVINLISKLDPNGEIHIFDSPFYETGNIEEAKKRSKEYFEKMGVPEMKDHFHHHLYRDLEAFNIKILYKPNSLLNRFRRNIFNGYSPFPWLVVSK
jgi:2-polyprenyl-3-methyl-5-hydroxy-6-metoxy-1,4-benzoquinol methylase